MAESSPNSPEGTVAIYARMSMDRTGAGIGIERQVDECRALLHRRGVTDDRIVVYPDNDISAFTGKRRPNYELLLDAIRDGSVRHLATWHNDRLHRRPIELETFIDIVEAAHIGIDTVTAGSFDLSTPSGRLVARNLGAAARFESEHKSERLLARKRQARQQGLPNGGPRPFGWLRITVTNQDGTTRETWDPRQHDPAEAALIRDATDAVIAGASLFHIAETWNEAGIPQPRAGRGGDTGKRPRWDSSDVKHVLTSPRNAGLVPHSSRVADETGRTRKVRGFLGEGDWPAIVDRAKWERCRDVIESRASKTTNPRRTSLLTGLLLCGRCGSKMMRGTYTLKNGSTAAWHCPGGSHHLGVDGKPACHSVSMLAAPVEEHLTAAVFEWADNVKLARMVAQQTDEQKEAARIASALADVARHLNELADSLDAGRLSMASYERATARAEQRQRDLQSDLAKLGKLRPSSVLVPVLGRSGALQAMWPSLTQDQRRAAIRESIGVQVILPATKRGRVVDERRIVPAIGFVPLRLRESPTS
jgi:site-specific DNA recombinase